MRNSPQAICNPHVECLLHEKFEKYHWILLKRVSSKAYEVPIWRLQLIISHNLDRSTSYLTNGTLSLIVFVSSGIAQKLLDFSPPENMAATAPLFDAAQLTSFFEGPDFMALSNHMRLQLGHEGITVPDDFIDFDAEGLKGIFLNLLKPPKIPAAGAAALAAGRLREIMAYEVSAKSKMLLKERRRL
jgi:hypothetical protein